MISFHLSSLSTPPSCSMKPSAQRPRLTAAATHHPHLHHHYHQGARTSALWGPSHPHLRGALRRQATPLLRRNTTVRTSCIMEQALKKAGIKAPAQPAQTSPIVEPAPPPSSSGPLPALVVLDLDNTVWTPELYQLRTTHPPKAGRDVQLFPATREILREIADPDSEWASNGTRVAIASRTHKYEWAMSLLKQFEVVSGKTLYDLVCGEDGNTELIQIIRGHKIQHFKKLKRASGVEYSDMLFFDDALGGRYGNCEPIARDLGVMAAHCPQGLTSEIWDAALKAFGEAKQSGDKDKHHVVVSESGRLTKYKSASSKQKKSAQVGGWVTGKVKMWNDEKGFGFIVLEGMEGDGDLFAHRTALENGMDSDDMTPGMSVRVQIGSDRRTNRRCATSVELLDGDNNGSVWPTVEGNEDAASMPCLSLCQPFATLILNGVKTIETRNNPELLKPFMGQKVLIRIGMRDWPDDEGWRKQMQAAGYSTEDMERLSKLPPGVRKGDLAGVVEMGKTMPNAELAKKIEGGWPSVEQGVCASKHDMMKYSTPLTSPAWFKKPIKAKGNFAGVWYQKIPDAKLNDLREQ